MDDIVTRLRERAVILFSNGADGNAFIDEHAADEIERLRASLEYQKELVYAWRRAARMYRGGLLQAHPWSEAEKAFLDAEELENRG